MLARRDLGGRRSHELDHRPRQCVARSDELRDEPRPGLKIDVGLTADLLDPAGVHDDDPVGDRERLRLVMRDVDRRLARPPLELADCEFEAFPEVLVEGRQWLVEEEDPWVRRKDAGEGDPLLLTARELARHPRAVPRQVDHGQHLLDAARDRGLPHSLDRQAEPDVLGNRQMREERRRLEDEADVSGARRQERHVLVVKPDAAAGRLHEPRDHPQGRRLAAAGRAEERDELAIGHVEVELVDRDRRAVMLRDRGQPDGRHQSRYVPLRWRAPKRRKNSRTAAREISCIVTASAAVVGARPAVRIWLKTRSGAVVSPGGWTNSVTRYSLKTMMKHRRRPALTPGPISGRMIRR